MGNISDIWNDDNEIEEYDDTSVILAQQSYIEKQIEEPVYTNKPAIIVNRGMRYQAAVLPLSRWDKYKI